MDGQAGPVRRLPDITLSDLMTFIVLALQTGHEFKDTLHDCWSIIRQLHTPFYGETMTRDRLLHILHFLHFANNSQRLDEGKEYDQLWKLRIVFETLNEAYAKFCNPSEHLTVDKIIKIYKLFDDSGYTFDMRVYLGKDSPSATYDMSATHATVRHLTCNVEGLEHKIFMDNFFSSPRLFHDLDRHKINSCGTVWPNRKDMPQ